MSMLMYAFIAGMSLLTGSWGQVSVQPGQEEQPKEVKAVEEGARIQPRQEGESEEDRAKEREERRARMQRYMNASPAERMELRTDRWVERTTRMYNLTDDQQQMVRGEIVKMRDEYRAKMGPDADEYDRLRDEMMQFWTQADTEEPGNPAEWAERRRKMMDDPKIQETRKRMSELERKYPFDWRETTERIEKMLPEEQVKAGREKWEARRSEWEQRRTDRRGERMARGSGDRGAGEGRRERFRGREGGQPGEGKAEIKPVEPKEPVVTPPVVNPPVQTPPAPQQPVLPPDPWEVYTREFIGKHGLSEAQSASALAILKELKTRAEQTERAIADRVKAAEKVADAAERQKKLTELRQPIDRMFEELKTRLEALLTAAQRSKAKEAASK